MTNEPTFPDSFEDLAASRRAWIDDVLHRWCLTANRRQLLQAASEWLDIAGRADVDATLWTWAWERFENLTHPDLSGVNETHQVTIRLKTGESVTGFPDSRASQKGQLVLLRRNESGATDQVGPFSIDDITSVSKA